MGNAYSYLGNGSEVASSAGPKAWSRTKMHMQTYEYSWTIDQFPLWLSIVAKAVEKSPTFSTGEHEWRLTLHSNKEGERKDYISLYIMSSKSPQPKVLAEYTLGILNDEGKRISILKSSHTYFAVGKSWGSHKFILKANLLNKDKRYLSNDSLTLFCQLNVWNDPSSESGIGSPLQVTLPECHLTNTFPSHLHSGKFSDVTLVVAGEEFHSYKIILASASPVFAAMFEHNMKEKLENRVEIEDVALLVFKKFLHFIYTGKVNNLEKNAEALLILAERYEVQRLKAICEKSLASQLSLENVAGLHCLAHRHNATQLKAITSDFLRKNYSEISKSDAFQSLIKNSPHPLLDLFQQLLAEKNS